MPKYSILKWSDMKKLIPIITLVLLNLLIHTTCTSSLKIPLKEETSFSIGQYELNSDWVCRNINDVNAAGEDLSRITYTLSGWIPATVPGTVLTTLLDNDLIPDPFYGTNNERIPDVYNTGRDHYTYWFVKDFFEEKPTDDEQIWLNLRGVNYSCDLYLNGQKLNKKTHYGMFLRQTYNITNHLSETGNNRLAVIVYPPDPVGNPNGGQGGDGTIARNVTNQYVAGWDWIQPVRDRNTGIWDKVMIEKTDGIRLKDPHVITIVPGKRFPGKLQAPAIIKSSAYIDNPIDKTIEGRVQLTIGNKLIAKDVRIEPKSSVEIKLPDYILKDPKLWWPNGYGGQPLYELKFQFIDNDSKILDEKIVKTGIRQIRTRWNERTRSMEVMINGQKIFIKGGNWIASDAMLRLSSERYDAEVRFHRDMNLNLIRIWGGSLTERPEFYEACDNYGILVMQDFWMSGDCNGKWNDPKKKEDQWTRRQYPDDHDLFLKSVTDQVKMIRNHPSLGFYCGGNEIPPPKNILTVMVDSLLPSLDSTRYFFEYSNADSMSHNFIGGNGDGPYHLQPIKNFWERKSFPFNSEIGSVGIGDINSIKRFMPQQNQVLPGNSWRDMDSVWRYHRPSWYGKSIDKYGKPSDLEDFAKKAQLVNYNQYRALMEGHISRMWDWYTGLIIWKTQNPWTALRGQMYDYYLDPNAGLYGLHHANKKLHVMYNPVDGMLMVANHTFNPQHDIMIQAKAYDFNGNDTLAFQWIVEVGPTTVQKIQTIKRTIDHFTARNGGFLSLRLFSDANKIVDDNFYWIPDSAGNFSGLQEMEEAKIKIVAQKVNKQQIKIDIVNAPNEPVAFFNRISLIDNISNKRLLPTFYSDNYVSILPGEKKTVFLQSDHIDSNSKVSVQGWNLDERCIEIK